jgi:hypothetical protein
MDNKKESWESGIKILKNMQVIIPLRLLLVCNQIAGKVRGDEFSIVTNIAKKEDTELILAEDYYIPKQVVASTSIEYQPDEYKFNCVIHRHPDGMNNFSTTDQQYINQNFELSILYTKEDGFVQGVYNLRHENNYLIQLPVEIFIDYGIEDIDISNIQKPAPLVVVEKRKHKSRHERRISDLDLDRAVEPDTRKEKLFPEESLDYSMMKDFMLEEVNTEFQDINYRLTNLEESVFHHSGISSFGSEGYTF